MEWERQRVYDYEDGKAAGMEAGKEAKSREDAIAFYENGVSVEIIAKSLKMKKEDVEKIVKEECSTN